MVKSFRPSPSKQHPHVVTEQGVGRRPGFEVNLYWHVPQHLTLSTNDHYTLCEAFMSSSVEDLPHTTEKPFVHFVVYELSCGRPARACVRAT